MYTNFDYTVFIIWKDMVLLWPSMARLAMQPFFQIVWRKYSFVEHNILRNRRESSANSGVLHTEAQVATCKNCGECEKNKLGVPCDLSSPGISVRNLHYYIIYFFVGLLAKEDTFPLLLPLSSPICWWRPGVLWSALPPSRTGEFRQLIRRHMALGSFLSRWTVYSGCQ